MEEIERRKQYTHSLIERVNSRIDLRGDHFKAESVCVYATGSTGRFEASEHSDLDLIMLSRSRLDNKGVETDLTALSALDEICIKADFINALRDCSLKDLDGQGKYFANFTANGLIKAIGAPDDDVSGAFTARLLLLLESRALVGGDLHHGASEKILGSYWTDFPPHANHFIPAYFVNDILRLWRTFCVNYEARTRSLSGDQRFKKRVKNLKLKYSRLLTCYSSILFLLQAFDRHGTVTPDDARDMCSRSPIERLLKLREEDASNRLAPIIDDVLHRYNEFMVVTNRTDDELVEHMSVADNFETQRVAAYGFSHSFYRAIEVLGRGNAFHRLIVV